MPKISIFDITYSKIALNSIIYWRKLIKVVQPILDFGNLDSITITANSLLMLPQSLVDIAYIIILLKQFKAIRTVSV